jgi:hypothetical protein
MRFLALNEEIRVQMASVARSSIDKRDPENWARRFGEIVRQLANEDATQCGN